MELSIYNVIRGAHMTSKAYRLNRSQQQLVLKVHPAANKPMVAEALKKLFNVEVESIRMIVCKGKRSFSRRYGVVSRKPSRKKAIVSLKPGQEGGMQDITGVPQEPGSAEDAAYAHEEA